MDLMYLVKSDLRRFGCEPSSKNIVKNLLNNNRSFKYTFWLKLCKSKNSLVKSIAKLLHYHYSNKYQIQIPQQIIIGPGFNLGHATTVVVSSTTLIDTNCNISQFVNIGTNHGQAATIGNNVYIGPNCCLVENVQVGDNVTIGAGSIVVNNIPNNATAVGNPARTVNYSSPAQYITNPAIYE